MISPADYYRLTEDSYRALCPERSDHMNLGIWPARSLREAQEGLIRQLLEFHQQCAPGPTTAILDAGSGWGGSRKFFHEAFPGADYIGINSSLRQIRQAELRNRDIPRTRYIHREIESIADVDLGEVGAFFSVEAAFHFKKDGLFNVISAKKIRTISLAEICLSDSRAIEGNEHLNQALGNAWSIERYEASLASAGFGAFRAQDITQSVFFGWTNYLQSLDPARYGGHRKMLRRFIDKHLELDALVRSGLVTYHLIFCERPI